MATVKIEGMERKVDDAIAKDDASLRDLLSTVFPDAKTAEFKRTTVNGQLIVTVNKQPGKKGGLVEDLLSAEEAENPCVTLSRKLAARPKLRLTHILAMQGEIVEVRDQGRIEESAQEHAISTLTAADAQAVMLPIGF